MPDILVITGNCGVGKSTLARAWADARGGAAIHADDMHLWIRVQAIRRSRNYQEQWKADVAIAAAAGLVAQGLDVAIENVWSPASCDRLREALAPVARVCAVRLWCERPVNHQRDRTRSGAAVMGPRVDTLADELERMDWPASVHPIDTTNQSIEETCRAIDSLFAG